MTKTTTEYAGYRTLLPRREQKGYPNRSRLLKELSDWKFWKKGRKKKRKIVRYTDLFALFAFFHSILSVVSYRQILCRFNTRSLWFGAWSTSTRKSQFRIKWESYQNVSFGKASYPFYSAYVFRPLFSLSAVPTLRGWAAVAHKKYFVRAKTIQAPAKVPGTA